MKKYLLPITWESYGEIEIEAKDDIDFLSKVEKLRIDDAGLPLPTNGKYIDDSFNIDEDDLIIEINEMVVDDIIKAKAHVKFIIDSDMEYPEDEWWGVSSDHDLNIWTEDDTGIKRATMYPIIDGKTDTSVYIEIYKEIKADEKDSK